MPAITTRGYPYPVGGDPIDVAGDTQRLAEAIDVDVTAVAAAGGGGSGFDQADADLLYVKIPGDTMTGPLIINSAVAGPLKLRAAGDAPGVSFQTVAAADIGYVSGSATSNTVNLVASAASGTVKLHTGGAPRLTVSDTRVVADASVASIAPLGVWATGTNSCQLQFFPGSSNGNTLAAMKGKVGYNAGSNDMWVNNVTGTNLFLASAAGASVLFLSGSETFRITGVNTLWGKTSSNAQTKGFEINASNGTSTAVRQDAYPPLVSNAESAATGARHFSYKVLNTEMGSVTRNALTNAVLYKTTSDANWKANVADLDPAEAIARVEAWRPVTFQWKQDAEGRPRSTGTPTGPVCTGFIAQEMVEVSPLSVSPGISTEDEHVAWQQRMAARAALEQGYVDDSAAYEAEVAARVERGDPLDDLTAPTPVELPPIEDDPFSPWGMDNSFLIPDLVATVQSLLARIATLEGATP